MTNVISALVIYVIIVEENGYSLNRANVIYTDTDIKFPLGVEKSNILYRFDLYTSYNTRHKATLELNSHLPTFRMNNT